MPTPKDYYSNDFNENPFVNTFMRSEHKGYQSFDDFYLQELFDAVQIPDSSKFSVCLGFLPCQAQYHGIKTMGGYLSYYPLATKESFEKIQAKEIAKNPAVAKRQQTWSNKLFYYSHDLKTEQEEINSLDWAFEMLRSLGCETILSLKKINLANTPVLQHIKLENGLEMFVHGIDIPERK